MAEEAKKYELNLTAQSANALWDAINNFVAKGRAATRMQHRISDAIKTNCMDMTDEDTGSFKKTSVLPLTEDQYDQVVESIDYRTDKLGVPGALSGGYCKLWDEMDRVTGKGDKPDPSHKAN